MVLPHPAELPRLTAGRTFPAYATGVLAGATLTVLGATAPALAQDFGVTALALTAAYGLQTVGMLAGAALAGAVRHRAPRIWTVALLTAVALVAAALAPRFDLLVAALAVGGAGCYALNSAAQAALMSRGGVPRPVAMSRFHLLGATGAVAFPLLVAGSLALGATWRAAFVAVALGYATVAVAAAPSRARLFAATPRLAAPVAPRSAGTRIGPAGRWALAIILVGVGIQVAVPLHLGTLTVELLGTPAATGSLAVGVFWLGLLLARLIGTVSLRRLGLSAELWASCALLLAGWAVLALATGLAALLAAALLMGAGVGQLLPLAAARAAEDIADDAYTSSVTYVASAGAQLLVPGLLAGLLLVVDLRPALTWICLLAALLPLAVARSGVVRRERVRR